MIEKYRLPLILILIGLIISFGIYIFSINRINLKHTFITNNSNNTDILTLVDVEEPLPIYPDFVQIKTDKQVQTLGTVYRVDYESKKTVPELAQYFIEQLPKNNWEIDTVPADITNETVQQLSGITKDQLVHVSLVKDLETNKTKVNFQVISRLILDVEEGE